MYGTFRHVHWSYRRYYFEPLFFANDIGQMNRFQDFSRLSLYLLENLFNCSLEAVDRFLPLSRRNGAWKKKFYSIPPCNGSDQPQIAKVIRFQFDHDALAWIRSRNDIKVRIRVAISIRSSDLWALLGFVSEMKGYLHS